MSLERLVFGAAMASVLGCGGATLPGDGDWEDTGGTEAVAGNPVKPGGAGGSDSRGGNGPDRGGTTASGGIRAAGGHALGGAAGWGGAPAQNGGSTNQGGFNYKGGTRNTAGNPSFGGSYRTGGTLNRGGTPNAGGTFHVGGWKNVGGTQYTGGVPNTGGTLYVGGGSGMGGSAGAGGACSAQAIEFVMIPPSDGFCDQSGWCELGDWLEIRTASGTVVPRNNGCVTTCDQCQEISCDYICRVPQRVPLTGAEATWDGSVYALSNCATATAGGTSQILKCVQPECAPPGEYVARMCAYTNANIEAGTCAPLEARCVDVKFQYPTTTVVKGYLGATN